jgi:hypothetical protein
VFYAASCWLRNIHIYMTGGSIVVIFLYTSSLSYMPPEPILPRTKGLYSSLNIVRVIISRRLRWVGHVAHVGEGRGVYGVLVGSPKGRDHWEDLGIGGRITLRWTLGRWDQ